MKPVLLIPAYNPDEKLLELLNALPANAFEAVLVVDDGSAPECESIIKQVAVIPQVTLLSHDVNQGKGAALKTGFACLMKTYPDASGVVTADADGQHSVKDILAIAQALESEEKVLTIGCRTFDASVPLRSHLGNRMTRWIMRSLFKIKLTDTQSGLRAIPFSLLEFLLPIPYNRYEFEIEMLMAARKNGFGFKEIGIDTIYEDNNASSSFNPIKDSAKIYFVLFRYILASLATATVDYMVFFAGYELYPKIFFCTYLARLVALFVNFIILKQFVFHSKEKVSVIGAKYLMLVVVSGFISSIVIDYLNTQAQMNIVLSKVCAELILYFAIFVVQKEFVFRRKDV